jgi:DNA sulfur modification protein DndB
MFEYEFIALRGRQAGCEYYSVMCPLKLIPKLFLFQETEIPAELRAQRTLNKSRIPTISRYIVDNRSSYIFSSLTASIDGEVRFESIKENGSEINGIGRLRIPMESKFLINDGQHRRAAIEAALDESPEIGDETISVVFFIDLGLERSQQMFADLNKHVVRPTKSIGILYDRRDVLSDLSRNIIEEQPVFRNLTEMEKSSISNRSINLFTLSSIYQATSVLLGKTAKCKEITQEEIEYALDFWEHVCQNMPDWRLAAKKDIPSHELRRDCIHAHALVMHALGKVGWYIKNNNDLYDYKEVLKGLPDIDWRRSNSALWEGRAMTAGKISKSHTCVILTTNKIKQDLGLPLEANEQKVENEYLRSI